MVLAAVFYFWAWIYPFRIWFSTIGQRWMLNFRDFHLPRLHLPIPVIQIPQNNNLSAQTLPLPMTRSSLLASNFNYFLFLAMCKRDIPPVGFLLLISYTQIVDRLLILAVFLLLIRLEKFPKRGLITQLPNPAADGQSTRSDIIRKHGVVCIPHSDSAGEQVEFCKNLPTQADAQSVRGKFLAYALYACAHEAARLERRCLLYTVRSGRPQPAPSPPLLTHTHKLTAKTRYLQK